MEEVTIEEKRKEALLRMKMLKLHSNVIDEFWKENKLNKSEGLNAILFFLTDEEKKRIKRIEEKYKILVYHVIHTYTTNLGELYDLLYVSNHKEEWEYDRQDIKQGIILSRTEVIYDSINSEFGSIGIQSKNGGVVRTC